MNDRTRGFFNRGAAPQTGQTDNPAIETIHPEDATEADDRCGRSCTRGMFAGVILEMPRGEFEGIYYGAIQGRVRYNPSQGIMFRFEDSEGTWEVNIAGSNLHDLHRDLTLMRRESIRVGDKGAVTEITIRAWKAPKEKG